MKQYIPKKALIRVKYRNLKNVDITAFRNKLHENLSIIGQNITYNQFEDIFMGILDKDAPMKEKYIRANNGPFMNKTISKAIMNRSRLRNSFIKNPNEVKQNNYKRQRNYVVNVLRREKKKYYDNIDPCKISDIKKFWKSVKPFFSEKNCVKKANFSM